MTTILSLALAGAIMVVALALLNRPTRADGLPAPPPPMIVTPPVVQLPPEQSNNKRCTRTSFS